MNEFNFQKYLKKNPSEIIEKINSVSDGFFHIGVVIPVLGESEFIWQTLQSLEVAQKNFNEEVLVLLVFNHNAKTPIEYIKDNEILIEKISAKPFKFPRLNLSIINLTTPLRYAVGEARKKGMDSIIELIAPVYSMAKNSIIVSLDADTLVESDYFSKIKQVFESNPHLDAAAFEVIHQHSNDEKIEKAIRHYERYLENYYLALKECNSPFAYKSVGSALAVRVSSYIQAGGMRQERSGEDFYFLEAVAKIGKVDFIREIIVHPSPRISKRVAFGTGIAVEDIINGKNYPDFSTHACQELKKLLDSVENHNLISVETFLNMQTITTRNFLIEHNFPKSWEKVLKNYPHNQLSKQFKFYYFDALKTLQFLKRHSLTEQE